MHALWVAVVLQAVEDVDAAPIRSANYEQAADFFTSGGQWALSRTLIADALQIDPAVLAARGAALVAARRKREGLPDPPPPPPAPPAPEPPIVVVMPATPPVVKIRRVSKKWTYNPFNPHLRRTL